jgi:AraC-like DNA-binding protein
MPAGPASGDDGIGGAGGAEGAPRHADGLRRRQAAGGNGAPAAAALESLLDHVSCTVLAAGCWLPVPADWRLRASVPPNYVAMLCVGGGAEYRIGEQTYALRPGGLLLCPPRVPREGRHDPADPLHLYSVHFQARLYGTLDMPAVYRLPVALTPAPERHALMVQAARRAVAELHGTEAGHVLAANGAGAELLALIWRDVAVRCAGAAGVGTGAGGGSAGSTGSAVEIARLAPVLRLIEARYAGPLSLEQLAEAMHLQPAYFSTLFRRVVGTPPMRYLARYRLDRVRELLLSGDLPLDEIARRTGFSDAPYLIRAFRRAERTTPGEYRRTKASPMAP